MIVKNQIAFFQIVNKDILKIYFFIYIITNKNSFFIK